MSAAPDAAAGKTRALQYQFAAHLRDPGVNPAPIGLEDRRLKIYRELFFNNIDNLFSSNFPVIRTLLDDAEWHALIRAFYREHQSHTPLFPEIAREFLRYLEARQQRNEPDPPFLLELAHYEWAELALSLDENEINAVPHEPDGDPVNGIPVVSPLAWRLGYRFPVHRIRPDYQPHTPSDYPTLLLLVRNREDQVGFLEINAMTALLFERLQENSRDSGLVCLNRMLDEASPSDADKETLRQAGISLLRELKARTAILGTRV